MANQELVNTIAEKLNELRATDPRFQAAWELLAPWRTASNAYPLEPLRSWPDGAVRGLLEQVVETAKLSVEGPQINTASGQFHWWGAVPSLGKAILEALNEHKR